MRYLRHLYDSFGMFADEVKSHCVDAAYIISFKCQYRGTWFELTSKCFRSCQAGCRMRAHNTANIILALSKLIQHARCKFTLSIIVVDDELSDPTHIFILISPMASKYITNKAIVDGNSDVRADGAMR